MNRRFSGRRQPVFHGQLATPVFTPSPMDSDVAHQIRLLPSTLAMKIAGTRNSCPPAFKYVCDNNTPRHRHCVREPGHCEQDDWTLARTGVPNPISTEAFGSTPIFTSVVQAIQEKSRMARAGQSGNTDPHVFHNLFDVTNILSDQDKNSASNTIIVFGTHRMTGQKVVMKFFAILDERAAAARLPLFHEYQRSVESLIYEAHMYKAISAEPSIYNAVQFVGFFIQSPTVVLERPFDHIMELVSQKLPVGLKNLRNTQLAAIVTEHRPRVESFLKIDPLSSPNVRCNRILQMLYTLYAMTKRGFQHNDLHTGNILVDPNPDEHELLYQVGDQMFRVPVMEPFGKMLIYDWDLGYCELCPDVNINPKLLDSCTREGSCNQINEKFDMYTFLRVTYYVLEKHQIYDPAFIAFYTDVLQQLQAERHYGRMCRVTPDGVCQPFPRDGPSEMWTIANALRHPYFKDFRV
jgi:serine/threonine protein kinase